jgi:hypothetical protein
MIIKKFFPWAAGLLVLLLLASTVEAGGPPLVASDLEAEIQNLPRRCSNDPILPLQKRLAELKVGSREHRALEEAVSLIRIFRQTRISSKPSR